MANTGTGTLGTLLQAQGPGISAKYTTATYPSTAAASGKILISDGTNIVSSTPTFPNASATTRKIIVSDGTNWTASTETWAVPSTSGNVLTSDGTNWTSAAPTGGSSYSFQSIPTVWSPADSATYYMPSASTPITSISANSRMWIPKTGTIRACTGACSVTGTLGSNENVTIGLRLNDTTTTNVTTTLQLTGTLNTFSNTALSIAVTAGDYITVMFICPSWATNPTNCFFNCTFFIS